MVTGTDLVAGRYRVGGLLGSGGRASVFLATDVETGTAVALKLLHPHLATRHGARDELFREARAAGSVRHLNLVSVLDVGVHDSESGPVAWIALELAPGVSLGEHVELHGPLAIADALAVAVGVGRALEAAHAAGLAHRDISPANIMVDPGEGGALSPEQVRLVDFGLADVASRSNPVAAGRAVGGDDASGVGPTTVVGNANYMSPEQAVGGEVGGRGDLYQLGAVLYFMLTGRPPYPRATVAATLKAHVSAPQPVPSVMRPDVPRAVDRIVVKAMLKQPGDRYQTAAELLEALEAAAGAPVAPDARTLLLRAAARPVTAPPALRTALRTAPHAAPDTPWAWRVGIALVVVGALVAWIVSSATSAPPPEAEAAPAATEQPAATAPPRTRPVAPDRVAVPTIVGVTLADASAAIIAAGLVVGAVSEAVSPLAGGSVSASAPEAGAEVDVGGVVDLVVASGRNLIPSVAGLSRDAAVAAIQGAGFGVFLTASADASAERGTVVSTSPVGGAQLAVGQPVTITVASGPSPTATPAPTDGPTPVPTTTPEPSAG